MTLVETYEHKGVEVQLFQDIDCSNPREETLTTFAAYHPSYTIGGGERDYELPAAGFPAIDCPTCEGGELFGDCLRCEGVGEVTPTPTEWLREQSAVVAAPLFMYEHSGVTYRLGDFIDVLADEVEPADLQSRGRFPFDGAGWDTSFIGFVYVTLERALELGIPGSAFPNDDIADGAALYEAMCEQASNELETYSMWAEGDCYIYTVAEDTPAEESVGGFIGHGYAVEEANEAAERAAETLRENAEANAREMAECATAPFIG